MKKKMRIAGWKKVFLKPQKKPADLIGDPGNNRDFC